MTWTTDNRYASGASGATAPEDAPAAYSARWIDRGNSSMADILGDRQGFAYNNRADMERLITLLGNEGDALRIQGDRKRDASMLVRSTDELVVNMRRSGGYIYVDAWLVPSADVPQPSAAELRPRDSECWSTCSACPTPADCYHPGSRWEVAADVADWQYEVANGDTVLGLAEWVAHRNEADAS